MVINPYASYVVPGGHFGQYVRFSGYYPAYSVRTYPLYPSYYPWYYQHYHGGWSGEWHNGYNGTILTDNNILKTERQWPKIKIPKISTPKICLGYTGYKTNKFDLKSNIESGGWIAGWADDIAEKDVAQGAVAAGVSVASSNPAPFLAWIENLVDRTISSLSSDVKQKFTAGIKSQINQLAADIIKQAIQGKSPREALKRYDTFDFKAGAIRYSGRNMLCGQTVSTTWGMKPYLAFRVR